MVSIIERNNYLSELRKNEKFDLFFSFLFSVDRYNEFEINAEVDDVFQGVLVSFTTNNQAKFNEYYGKISKRVPNKYSPFTNDDLLIFVLVVGALKFEKDLDWVSKVLDVRENSNEEGQLIKKTFQNIISGNFMSNDNAFQLIVVIEELLERNILSWDEKKRFYIEIIKKSFPFYRSELLNIAALRAYDLIVLEGDKSNESHYVSLREFERVFIKKIQLLSKIIVVLICAVVFGLIIWLVFSPKYEGVMGKFDTIFGIIGVSVFYFISGRVINWIDRILREFLGYPKKRKENE